MVKEIKPGVMAAIDRQQSLLYLTLILGHEVFAWDGLHIRDVVDCDALIEMGDMPGFIRGGVHWCGEAVPVVDLEARMSHGVTPITKCTRIVIVETGHGPQRQWLGLVMNPLAPARGGLRTASDIRQAIDGMLGTRRASEAEASLRQRRQRGAALPGAWRGTGFHGEAKA